MSVSARITVLEMVIDLVGSTKFDAFSVWAWGPKYAETATSSFPRLWNERHGAEFTIDEESPVGPDLERMVTLWRAKGEPMVDMPPQEDELADAPEEEPAPIIEPFQFLTPDTKANFIAGSTLALLMAVLWLVLG